MKADLMIVDKSPFITSCTACCSFLEKSDFGVVICCNSFADWAGSMSIIRIKKPTGVKIAVHPMGGCGPLLLFAPANGFHGRCYKPLVWC